MYYPDDVIEEVRTRNDIVDVISQYVNLKKKGANYFGLCPFHNEKSPSFSVSPGKQMYYCFGCGAGGNVITFIMEYENYSFVEAVKYLADRAGITLPEVEYSKEARAQADLKNTLLEINRLAGNYFYYQLKQPQGRVGYEYFRNRGLSDETIRRFGLGYSLKTPDDLYRYMRSKGYGDGILKETGLFYIEERGSRDKFWNRVMFPILDVNNRLIGFGGRVMGEGEPKYLNSPETKLFDKSRNLYGLNFARTSRTGYMLVCEGVLFNGVTRGDKVSAGLRGLHGCDRHAPGRLHQCRGVSGNGLYFPACLPFKAVYGPGSLDLRQRRSRDQGGFAGDPHFKRSRDLSEGSGYEAL